MVTLEEARSRLEELLAHMHPEGEFCITRDGEPVALVRRAQAEAATWPCRAGSAQHRPHAMAPDFDALLDEFRDYME